MTVPTPIHWWQHDASPDEDQIGSADGTVTGTNLVASVFGDAREFTASGDNIALGDVSSLNFGLDSFTICQDIVFPDAGDTDHRALFARWNHTTNDRGYVLRIAESDDPSYPSILEFVLSTDGTAETRVRGPQILDGGRHRVVVTRSGQDYKIYVDAALVADVDVGSTLLHDDPADNYIGNFEGLTNAPVDCVIDNTVVWDQALTQTQVRELSFFPPDDTVYLTDFVPDANATVVDDTEPEFTIADDYHQVVQASIVIVVAGETAYTSSAWVAPYDTSSVIAANGTGFDATVVRDGGLPNNQAVDIDVHAENDAGGVFDGGWALFVSDPIRPAVPLSEARLIVNTQAIIIDFVPEPTEVRVEIDGGGVVEAWDNVTGFQNSWTGAYITDASNWRLVLEPPVPFSVNDIVEVGADATGGHTLSWRFYVGLEQLTTEMDLEAPNLVKATTYLWSGRVHNNENPATLPPQFDGPGNVYLQVLDPRGSEILVVPGSEVGQVYDATTGKVIIYFIRNQTVFYMEADPGDTPTTQSQLRSMQETMRPSTLVGAAPYDEAAPTGHPKYLYASFPPLKRYEVQNHEPQALGGGGSHVFTTSPHGQAPTPQVVSGYLTDDHVTLFISRPTDDHESHLVIGYHVVKFVHSTPNIIGYVTMAWGDDFVEFEDSTPTPGAKYAVMPVYRRWVTYDPVSDAPIEPWSRETTRAAWGAKALLGGNSLRQVFGPQALGGGASYDDSSFDGQPNVDTESFPPLKLSKAQTFEPEDFGGGGTLVWTDSSFDPIGT